MAKKKPMSTEEALTTVYQMAQEMQKGIAWMQTPKQRKHVQEALDVTHDFIINNVLE